MIFCIILMGLLSTNLAFGRLFETISDVVEGTTEVAAQTVEEAGHIAAAPFRAMDRHHHTAEDAEDEYDE